MPSDKTDTPIYRFLKNKLRIKMESKDSRREAFLFLFAAFIFFLALAAETRGWEVPVLTQILLGVAIVVGVFALLFFIYTWCNQFGDPMDKVPEILKKLDKTLNRIEAKIDKLGEENDGQSKPH